MDLNALDYLPKSALEHGGIYEGYTENGSGTTGTWDVISSRFIVKLYHWDQETREIKMTHPEDENEDYFVFYPMGEA